LFSRVFNWLNLDQVPHLVQHPSYRRVIGQDDRLVHAPKTKRVRRVFLVLRMTDNASLQRNA
jgi:hypothetical protein